MALKNECMEEKIKRAVSRTKMMFVYFWLLPVFLVIIWRNGRRMGRCLCRGRVPRILRRLSRFCLLLCWCLFPEAFFMDADQEDRCRCHYGCAASVCTVEVRLALLAMPVLAGFLTYYMMLSNKGVLCALIALTASLFCLPGEKSFA